MYSYTEKNPHKQLSKNKHSAWFFFLHYKKLRLHALKLMKEFCFVRYGFMYVWKSKYVLYWPTFLMNCNMDLLLVSCGIPPQSSFITSFGCWRFVGTGTLFSMAGMYGKHDWLSVIFFNSVSRCCSTKAYILKDLHLIHRYKRHLLTIDIGSQQHGRTPTIAATLF